MAKTIDERLSGLLQTAGLEGFEDALYEEVCEELGLAGPFLARAVERFIGRRSVCARQGAMARAAAAGNVPASIIEGTVARLLMTHGYALALADLAAVPSEDARDAARG